MNSTDVDVYQPFDEAFKQLQDSSSKRFVIYNELSLKMFNYKKEPKDRLYFHQLEQKVLSHNVHVALSQKSDSLHLSFDWKIKQLIQGGFFVHWIDRHMNHRSVKEKEPEDDRVVLTMNHLSVGFIIWFGILLIALIALIAEFSQFYLANHFQKIFFK